MRRIVLELEPLLCRVVRAEMYRAEPFLFTLILAIIPCYFMHITGAWITDPSEVAALRTIRSNLHDPMNNLNTWNKGDPCTSNWTGIVCNSTSSDKYLHVQKLQLLNLNLSGSLAPELGLLSHLTTLDVMWNNINGSIPKELGNITSLRLLLLNGNKLSGSLPEEIGHLRNLDRLQIDQNKISGPIPRSFGNLNNTRHLHMNNNSLSGQIPPGLSRLTRLLHLLLDNNNLSGILPPKLSRLPSLKILQVDNNNFSGSSIPISYGNMSTLLKLSLRNCSLQGYIPDFSRTPHLAYIDLSWNQLKGTIPANQLSINITTIDLSHNFLSGSIPSNFSHLPKLQRLSLENNRLDGSIPTFIFQNMTLDRNNSLILDFQNNSLTNSSNPLNPPENVTILLFGNPICANANGFNMVLDCQSQIINEASGRSEDINISCSKCPKDLNYEYNPFSPIPCLCAVPIGVGFRLKSPGISDFRPYIDYFEVDLTSRLGLQLYQLHIDSYIWERGPRLNMQLKLFPDNYSLFNVNEILRLRNMLAGWEITLSDIFGPYDLLYFTLGSYAKVVPNTSTSGLSNGVLIGILFGAIFCSALLSAVIVVIIWRRCSTYQVVSNRQSTSRRPIKITGVKCFTYEEMALATKNFINSTQVGQGGYGKVYKGILVDGTVVAIKRAKEGSLQGSKEFSTEIELLSRLHHRNLVSLVGYCDEEDEQMLVYEFMPNGTLRDHLSTKVKDHLTFQMRLRVALDTAKGILYLHTEANPPVFHRDIKASNILLDSNFVAKVADFGLSRLAPLPDVEGSLADHISTMVKGTPGYLDPEYLRTYKFTDKSDVYSLGVVFLELLTGMHPISHGKNIVREVGIAYKSGRMFSFIDLRMGSYPSECIAKFVSLALRCCRDDMDARPSMAEVVRELENIVQMMPLTDAMIQESMVIDYVREVTPSSSSIVSEYSHGSSSVSRSELSNTISALTPR